MNGYQTSNMALKKSIDSQYGVVAEYHRVVRVLDDRIRQSAEALVHVYKDAQSVNKQPLEVRVFTFSNDQEADGAYCLLPTEINPEGMNHVKRVYEALKLLPLYEGAIDV